ncbi:MAG: ribonuclease Z [Bacteroidales bacterium]|nr:ribonuclease Z [Bacteroidales bacterium]
MDSFTLNILGTASAKPVVNRFPSAQVLNVQGRLFLLDCGEGVQTRLLEMGLSLLRLEAVFISHLHGDHLFGIYGLLSSMGMLHREKPLRIFAPEGFGEVLDFYLAHFTDGDAFEIDFTPLNMTAPEVIFDGGSFTVSAFPLNHRVPTFGYLFREKERPLNIYKEAIEKYGLSVEEILALKDGRDVVRENTIIKSSEVTYKPSAPRSFAYCSDTAPFPELHEWVRGVNLLYHEATFPREMEEKAALTNHSTTLQAAQCAKDAGVGALVVGHYSSRFPDISFFLDELRSIFPNSRLGNDKDVIEI